MGDYSSSQISVDSSQISVVSNQLLAFDPLLRFSSQDMNCYFPGIGYLRSDY
jgi:hypothetical protein